MTAAAASLSNMLSDARRGNRVVRPPMARTLLQLVAAGGVGVVTYLLFRWDLVAISIMACVYTIGEAGAHQQREAQWPPLRVLASLPMADGAVFDRVFANTVASSSLVVGFCGCWFAAVAHEHALAWPAAIVVALGCGLLMWAVVLASMVVLLTALPRVPLTFIAMLMGIAAFSGYRSDQSNGHLAGFVLGTPGGWVARIFEAIAVKPLPIGGVASMTAVLFFLGWLNLKLLRDRYAVPEMGWRIFPAEQIFDMLVRGEAQELLTAGGAAADAELTVDMRQRATRNVSAAVRQAVLSGRWRHMPRPDGLVERLLWHCLPLSQREVAEFGAPMGQGASVGWRRAFTFAVISAVCASIGASPSMQVLGFLLVAWFCLFPGSGRPLDPILCAGTVPIDLISLLWIGLEIAALRIALWLPLLLFQAWVVAGTYAIPDAMANALRVALLVLALQPFLVALVRGGVDAAVRDYGCAIGIFFAIEVVLVVVLTIVGVAVILVSPPLAEGWILALVSVNSLAVFVIHALRLSTLEP